MEGGEQGTGGPAQSAAQNAGDPAAVEQTEGESMTDEMIREIAGDLADKIEAILINSIKSMRNETERQCVKYIRETIKELEEE